MGLRALRSLLHDPPFPSPRERGGHHHALLVLAGRQADADRGGRAGGGGGGGGGNCGINGAVVVAVFPEA